MIRTSPSETEGESVPLLLIFPALVLASNNEEPGKWKGLNEAVGLIHRAPHRRKSPVLQTWHDRSLLMIDLYNESFIVKTP